MFERGCLKSLALQYYNKWEYKPQHKHERSCLREQFAKLLNHPMICAYEARFV